MDNPVFGRLTATGKWISKIGNKLTRAENLEWDILKPDLLINVEINIMKRTSNI